MHAPDWYIETQAGQSFGSRVIGRDGCDAVQRVWGITRQIEAPLTLAIHSRIADTLGRVYLEEIEQIREQHDQVQLHRSARIYKYITIHSSTNNYNL